MSLRHLMVPFVLVFCVACGSAGQPSTMADTAADPGQYDDFDWRANIVLSDVPETGFSGNDYGSDYYADVMGHAQRKVTGYSPTTNGHETNHMLNNEVRNRTSANDNTVYLDNGKAALVLEPQMRASVIRQYVPQYVKNGTSRYDLYLVRQTSSWPNVLYQFDEWGAYRTDARIGVELDEAGTLEQAIGNEICVMDGAADFLYFCSAAVLALAENEPSYLNDIQFKAAYAMLAEQTMEYYTHGQGRRVFDCHASDFIEHFVTAQDTSSIRAFLIDWMGQDWTMRVFGF